MVAVPLSLVRLESKPTKSVRILKSLTSHKNQVWYISIFQAGLQVQHQYMCYWWRWARMGAGYYGGLLYFYRIWLVRILIIYILTFLWPLLSPLLGAEIWPDSQVGVALDYTALVYGANIRMVWSTVRVVLFYLLRYTASCLTALCWWSFMLVIMLFMMVSVMLSLHCMMFMIRYVMLGGCCLCEGMLVYACMPVFKM